MTDQNLSISPNEAEEVWKDIPGFPGYQVSDMGRCRSFWRKISQKGQKGYTWEIAKSPQTILRQFCSRYCTFGLAGKTELVHRLVLLAFVGPCPPWHQACHKDGDTANNALTNLRWDSPKNNANDKHEHGTHGCGTLIGTSKLTEPKILEIREMYIQGVHTHKDLAKLFSVSSTAIFNALGKGWQHMPFPPNSQIIQKRLREYRQKAPKVIGKEHPHAKLTDEQILKIRELYTNGKTQTDIADLFGVCQSNISLIVRRKAWPHLP